MKYESPLYSWRIRENGSKFYVEQYRPRLYALPFVKEAYWYRGNYRGEEYPVYDTLAEAERWLDERVHPEKYNKIIRVYEPSA